MTNRFNTVFVVLLMVLSAFVSGLYTVPNSTQNELNENATAPFFSDNNSSVHEWVQAWTVGSNFTSNSVINVTWSAGDLVTNITYNVTLDIYAHNATSNTTYVIWDDFTVFNATSNVSSGNWNIPNATLSAGCYYGSVGLYDDNDGMHFDNYGFDLAIDMDCSGGPGNNSGPMELIQTWPGSNNYTTNDIVNISWSAEYLVTNITYNATVDIFGHNATSNTTYVIWDDFSVFTPTSNASSGDWNLPSATLPTGCYFVSVGLYDNGDGMHLANDGFNLDIGMDCSGGPGNNNGPMEWIYAWPVSNNYSTNDIVNISWSAEDLVTSITYNVTVDVFAHNATSNTTYVIWDGFSVFTATSNASGGDWNLPSATLPTGCYYVSVDLFDDNDGMHLGNDGFDLDIGMDCSEGSGNNSGPMESLDAWVNNENYSSSDEIPLIWAASNLVWNMSNISITYNVTVDVYGYNTATNTTGIVWAFGHSFIPNGPSHVDQYVIPANTLSTGCYFASFNLSDNDDGMFFDNTGFDFDVGMDCSGGPGNNSGGNNTGNTTGDCGTLDNLTDLMVWTDHITYFEGDTVEATFITNCTVLNQTYILGYEIIDATSGAVVLNNSANMWTWDAYYTSDYHAANWSGLSVGNYVVTAVLSDSSYNTIVSGTYTFSVNALSTAWGNGTARFIYVKPLAQSADQHTPFNLTFPAPPMANGSPYISNMICSKAAGHSADVWETYVPMPFNNITSWKVENTYGIVMGMFVMHDAQFAGIGSMYTPTVIFEQNMSFSGHGPSELVDQAYFNCPMVTVSSTLSLVTAQNGSVLSYVAGISVNNSGDWTGDLNWDVATVSNGSITALADIGGHLLIEATGALLDYGFNATGITADEICLNWELIDESGVELANGSECIAFTVIEESEECTPWNDAECNTEFTCPDGHLKVAVEAIDNVTGAVIEIWDCILPGDEDLPPGDSALPSIGVFGTLVASVFAVFIVAIRRDEE